MKVISYGGGCIEFSGHRNRKGYGKKGRGGRVYLAHRLAYEDAYGPIPDGLCVLHRCDNPPCVNPDHLFLGTRADNNADMDAKGRANRRAHAVLTAAIAAEIRRRRAEGSRGVDLAKEFGVSQQTVCDIAKGRIW